MDGYVTKSKHGTGEHVHTEIARYICSFLGAKVEFISMDKKRDFKTCYFLAEHIR